MDNNYINDPINLVHSHLLSHDGKYRYKNFHELCEILNLTEFELIDCINRINDTNNQTIPVVYQEGEPKISYHNKEFVVHELRWLKKRLKLMIRSDLHIGHVNDSVENIIKTNEEAEKRNVDYILDLGDILNGPIEKAKKPENVRIGTLEDSIMELQKYQASIPTYFITGNHDLGFMETDLCDIGRVMETECNNMTFLNNLFTCIDVGGLRINLSHGYIENKYLALIKSNKEYRFLNTNNPHMIFQGHYHIFDINEIPNTLLGQVPSLRYGANDIGVIFLTINELEESYEVELEFLQFDDEKQPLKQEMLIKKF